MNDTIEQEHEEVLSESVVICGSTYIDVTGDYFIDFQSIENHVEDLGVIVSMLRSGEMRLFRSIVNMNFGDD